MWIVGFIGFALVWIVALQGLKQAFVNLQTDIAHGKNDNVCPLHIRKTALLEIKRWPHGKVTAA